MTTVAWDGAMIAADSRVSSGNKIMTPRLKLYVCKNEAIAICGDWSGASLMREEYVRRGKIDKWKPAYGDESSIIVFNPSGARAISKNNLIGEVSDEKEAIGSGSEFADGCLRCGLNAHDTVEKTSGYDMFTGDGVKSIGINQLKHIPAELEGFWPFTYKDDIKEIDLTQVKK